MTSGNLGAPNIVEILLHYHTSPEVHPRFHAIVVKEAIEYLEIHGLIERTPTGKDGVYKTTRKGKAHVLQICNLPFPKEVFMDCCGKSIDI